MPAKFFPSMFASAHPPVPFSFQVLLSLGLILEACFEVQGIFSLGLPHLIVVHTDFIQTLSGTSNQAKAKSIGKNETFRQESLVLSQLLTTRDP